MEILSFRDWNQRYYERALMLYKQSILNHPRGFIQDLSNQPSIVEFAQEILKGGEFLGGFLQGELIGFIGIRHQGSGVFEVCKFHVDGHYQNRGFGSKLFDEVLRVSRRLEAKTLMLHVSKSQDFAIKIYKKRGFFIVEDRICEVQVGEQILHYPTLFMQLDMENLKLNSYSSIDLSEVR